MPCAGLDHRRGHRWLSMVCIHPACLASALDLWVPPTHGAFLPFQRPLLLSGRPARCQRWKSSPELFVLTQRRWEEQPSLSPLTAHSPTRTHRFPWPNARLWSGYGKAEEVKKGCLGNEEENSRFFCSGHCSSPSEIILPWGIGTTSGHSWCKYLFPGPPFNSSDHLKRKSHYSEVQPA